MRLAARFFLAQGARLPLPWVWHGMQRLHESVRVQVGRGGVRRVRHRLRRPRQVHGRQMLHPEVRPPRRRLRPLLQVHLRHGGVPEQEPVPVRRVHGRRRRPAAAQEGPGLLGRRRPRGAHVQGAAINFSCHVDELLLQCLPLPASSCVGCCFDGMVVVQISEKVKPHPVVVTLLTQVEELIPTWKIVPTKDVIDSAFKDPLKREHIRRNKLIYQDNPRLKTALELLRTSMDVEDSLAEVSMPFFILHGEADTVTDPEVSRALYDRAASADKTIKLYPGMWHGLTAGEPDDNVELIFADIVAWLNKRSHHRKPEHGGRVGSAPSEPARYQRRPVSGGSGMDSPVSIPRRRGGFLCGQCRM
ncbi:uncharacterized protein LOC119276703 isoform X1 [Triticum dicoccoides]|uniref:uncharacterized protein LOC119276703 isoform X1 n=1 Tax=Triticum dicoccoides TaxID=85692 RepID=UPI0018901919|nr:uncharacterized protein LOC119276703 isoform X1 [Triticum dicoccoides]